MSLAARLLNVFAIPGEVMEEVKNTTPSIANWLTPALLFIAAGWVGAWLIFSNEAIKHQLSEITDKAIQAQIEKAHMSKEQADQARQMGEKWGSISGVIGAYAGPVVVAFASPFWWGLIFWLVGTKALKGNFSYLKAVEVAGLSNMIAVLAAVIKPLLILVTGNLFASPSPVLFIKGFDPQNPLHSLLAVVNVMIIWILIVRSIGLARLSGVSFEKAAAWVFGLWITWTGLIIGFAAAIKAIFTH